VLWLVSGLAEFGTAVYRLAKTLTSAKCAYYIKRCCISAWFVLEIVIIIIIIIIKIIIKVVVVMRCLSLLFGYLLVRPDMFLCMYRVGQKTVPLDYALCTVSVYVLVKWQYNISIVVTKFTQLSQK